MIVPVFIPNKGCPHRCVFCEQEKITSQDGSAVGAGRVRAEIERAIASRRFVPSAGNEIAFYGGTFTSLPPGLIEELLGAALPYLEKGLFAGIRVSTRPDAVDSSRCSLISRYGVRTVELGVQSMNDRVLQLSGRGHTAADTVKAADILKRGGFRVGVQIMPGLPGDSRDIFAETVSRIISLRPDMARIYPALVIEGTALAGWYRSGRYSPLDLEEAIEWCEDACVKLEGAGIPVIRLGLMNSPSLREPGQILAGPWHESFGHIVRSRIHLKKISPLLPAGKWSGLRVVICTPPGEVSLLRGHRNEGLRWIEKRLGAAGAKIVPDERISPGGIEVKAL